MNRQKIQRHHFNVYFSDPMSVRMHIQTWIKYRAKALVRDGIFSSFGHSLFTVLDNRKQWEEAGEDPHWTKSLAWAFVRSIGGQVLRGLITRQTPHAFQHPLRTAAIVSACWALVNFSKDDMVYRLLEWKPLKTLVYLVEAAYASKEVQSGVDACLHKMPESHVAAIALGILSGIID